MATVRYFIPEDGDMEAQPNVFLAPKPRHQGASPTLGQIKQAFPLPGRYHFRFKTPVAPGGDREKGQFGVWMDCVDERQPVPTWQSTILAKVTRIGIEDDEDFDDDEDFHRPPVPTPAPTPPVQPTHQPHPGASMPPKTQIDIFGGPSPPAENLHMSSAPNLGSGVGGHGGDLLGGDFGGAAPTVTSNGGHQHHQNTQGNADFLGMTVPPANSPSYSQHHQVPHQHAQQHRQPPPQQQPPQHSSSGNSFSKFAQQNGPFGDLGQW